MKAIIIGAGIGGLGTAIALRKIGMDVKVFESKQEVRFAGAGLGIGANAVRALQQLDVGDQILGQEKRWMSFASLLASHLKQSPVIEDALLRYERERIGRTEQITRMSDRIGKVAQLHGHVSSALRDALFPLIPPRILEKQLKYLYEVRLDGLL